jgi:perosamine synthetase
VPTRPYFPPIHQQPYIRSHGQREGEFPVTEAVANRMLALPFHGELSDDQVDYVVDTLRRLIQ